MRKFLPMILLAALLLPACGSAAESTTAPPPATEAVTAASPTTAPAPTATATTAAMVEAEPKAAEPTAEMSATEPVNWLTNEGKLADGRTFLGNPDAPVTMIDYSDFL